MFSKESKLLNVMWVAPPVGSEEAICQTRSVLSLHQREWLQGSFVRCFAANPPALIAVSPLGPQSQQHVAVQKPLEGSRKCQQKKKNGEEISRDSKTDGCEGQQSKREECKSLPAIWRCQSSWCVCAACEISFISHCKTTSLGLNPCYLSQQWYVFKARPCHPCRYCSGF